MAEIATSMAQLESSNTSVRVRRAKRASRERGEPHHGGRRAFGHDRDGAIREIEAAAIRDATARLLAGESVSAVARGWRDQGITTPNGPKPWATPHLRRLLLQPRLAGARVVDGELVATGAIAPILTLDEHYELRAMLTDPARLTNTGRIHNHLLTGVLYCGLCGSRMVTHAVKDRPMYQCASRPHRPACGKVAITARLADEHIETVLLELVDTPEIREALERREQEGANGETARRLDADRARLQALNDAYWLDQVMPEREYRRLVGSLTDRIEQAEKALERARARTGLSLGGVDLRAEWPLVSLDTRRLILRLLIDRIDCDPAAKLGGTWQPDRLRVTPRTISNEQAGNLVSNR
jgi:site-specific DNA recombinase